MKFTQFTAYCLLYCDFPQINQMFASELKRVTEENQQQLLIQDNQNFKDFKPPGSYFN